MIEQLTYFVILDEVLLFETGLHFGDCLVEGTHF
jgi:hypothetical protein